MSEWSSLSSNKYNSCRRRTKHTQENINLLQEKLVQDPRISARKNGSYISKNTLTRITKRDLKWHSYKLHVRKERKNWLEENEDLLERVMAGMRRRMLVSLQRIAEHFEEDEHYSTTLQHTLRRTTVDTAAHYITL